MKILKVKQGTKDWLDARAGKVTASRINDVMAKIKSGEAAARRDYRIELVTEILTGLPVPGGYQSPEMLWGSEQEPFGRAAYEMKTGTMVDEVGLILHPSIDRAAASPDGMILDQNGGIEIKAPKTSTHIELLDSGKIPERYKFQMAWQQACGGLDWIDFVSWDPRLPEHLQLFIARYDRDPEFIDRIETEVRLFLMEVETIVSRLNNKVS